MTNKKTTDNEIVKALECCNSEYYECPHCPLLHKGCKKTLLQNALDLINRQKAEIERLKTNLNIELENYATEYDNKIKAEAYKEFATKTTDKVEKAKQKYERLCKEQGEKMEEHMHIHFNGIIKIVKDLLKELGVGDNSEQVDK